MPISHETVLFDVHDCKVAALLTDNTGEMPTYGELYDVPGIAEVGIDPNFVTAELKGDARVIAKKGRIDRVNFSGTYSKLSLDVRKVLLGETVSEQAAVAAGTVTGTTTLGSKSVTGTGYTSALAGRRVTGTGIPDGTYIQSVTGTEAFTLSKPATAAGSVTLNLAAQAERVRARLKSPASLGYFMIKFKIEDLDEGLGDLHVTVYKAQVTGGALVGSSTDNFSQPSFDAEGIALAGWLPKDGGFDEGVMIDTDLYAVKTDLALL